MVDADDLRQDWDAMEDAGRYQQRTAMRGPYNMADMNNNMGGHFTNSRRQAVPRMRAGRGQDVVTSSTAVQQMYQASRVLRQSAASLSSSSHHMGPVPEQSMNMYNPQDQSAWIHDSQQNELQAGYENVGNYTAQSYTNVADSQVPNGVADVTSGGPIQEQQPVDQGAMENEAMAEINEFFVTNPYQHSENAENLRTAQMQSPPMSSYTAPVYKTEAPDYSFETAQLYEPVVTDGVFPQQPEQPVVRTAAGGECHGVMKMDTECFEQNEPITSNYQFNTTEFTYNMVQRMPIEQMKAVYLAGEQQQYQQPLGVHPSSSSEAVQHHNVEATNEYKVGEEGCEEPEPGSCPDFFDS